jgi:glyoxylase-like metal-dependent hydrolase (beta-lactamase superfamily II)
MQGADAIEFWEGATKNLAPGITLVHCGGHFAGGAVLHWAAGAEGRGALLSGDILQVGPDGMVSFMYSYPNLIPLPARAVQAVAEAVRPFAYDRIYGAWWERVIESNAQAILLESVARYVSAIAPG